MSFVRLDDEVINLAAIAHAEFTSSTPNEGVPGLTIWFIGDPTPVHYFMEPAERLWKAIGPMGTRVEKFGRSYHPQPLD